MTKYFARILLDLLGPYTTVHITSDNHMPLAITEIFPRPAETRLIATNHFRVREGKFHPDLALTFTLQQTQEKWTAEPTAYEAKTLSLYPDTQDTNKTATRLTINPTAKGLPKSYALIWFRRLRQQGYLSDKAHWEFFAPTRH